MQTQSPKGAPHGEVPEQIEEILDLCRKLAEEEASVADLFEGIKDRYEALNGPDKEIFFRAMVQEIDVPVEEVSPLLEAMLRCEGGDPRWHGLLTDLRKKLYSPRVKLFRKFSRSPGGLKFLLDFRGDLLSVRRYSRLDLAPLDSDIVFLFEMWFQEGFLYLEEITLDSSYKQVELLKDRDLVHPMASIEEMGQRLGRDRRCFALYHRLLPNEPIIFIEVALTEGLVGNIADIMASGDAGRRKTRVDTAIFYSINNTQNGLAGLGLGKILIGKVVDYIRKEDERIKNFATLSPVPGFWSGYLKPILEGKDESFILKREDVVSFFPKRSVERILEVEGDRGKGAERFNEALLALLSNEEWPKDEEITRQLRMPMVNIMYDYVSKEKNQRDKPLDPVAGFHLGNGATVSLKNINFLANSSPKGLRESCGMMVNYVYTSNWLSQITRSLRRLEGLEIRGLFGRGGR
jgi:malonyl-CoA decarboxylase